MQPYGSSIVATYENVLEKALHQLADLIDGKLKMDKYCLITIYPFYAFDLHKNFI